MINYKPQNRAESLRVQSLLVDLGVKYLCFCDMFGKNKDLIEIKRGIKMNHTRGPWEICGSTIEVIIDADVEVDCTVIKSADGSEVCLLARDSECSEQLEANARLISAAPDMLEACKLVIEQAGLSTNSPCYIKLKQVIEKAEGK